VAAGLAVTSRRRDTVITLLASLGSADRDAFLWVVHHRISLLNPFFKLLTYLATGGTLWVALALLLTWRTGRPLIPIGLLAAVVVWGADGIATFLKVVTNRPRPFASIPHTSVLIAHPSSGSFPSAHATTAFAGAVLLSWLWPRGRIAFAAVAILVAFSRVYLGVHYPTDVLGGAAIGAAFAAAVIATVLRTRFRDGIARPRRIGTA
jgi:undecaprenyl-diphosphatase